ncbi:MAG: DUF86 domain-containing protein [Methanothrix sp.]|nr:DUF86 domain-containing protein [Methanothrix sp.]
MDADRTKRYKDKMNRAKKRADQICEWALGDSEDFIEDEKTKLATYKAFQEMTEACLDIIAMICKDSNIVPKDDYTNIQSLEWLDKSAANALAEANGLRNRIVHRYNHTDDLIALESMRALLPELGRFLDEVGLWIRKRL